jgi:hypothetical protein
VPLTEQAREGFLDLLFAKVAFGGGFLIDASDTGTPLTNLFISAHESSPLITSVSQTINETTYTGYNARISIARTFTASTFVKYTPVGNPPQIRNSQNVAFPTNSGGTTHVITHLGLGTVDWPSNGYLIGFTELATPRVVTPGFTPQFLLEELIWSLR